MENKQTAVEWLVSKIASKIDNEYWSNQQDITEYIEQAIAIEKEQMRLVYEGMLQNVGTSIKQSDLPTFEQYYNETYDV